MAEKKLDSIVKINGEDYEVIAETAKKVEGTLTIKTVKDGKETTDTFDGSADKTIEVGDANKIQVSMDNDTKVYATITISKNDPGASDGDTGNIWFKY